MKPLFKVNISLRDPMDPEKLITVGGLEVSSIGDVNIILTKDEIGSVQLESAEVAATPAFVEQLAEALLTFKELHAKMGEVQTAITHANTDLFAIHKWMTR